MGQGVAAINMELSRAGTSCVLEPISALESLLDVRRIVEHDGVLFLATRYDGLYYWDYDQGGTVKRVEGIPAGSMDIQLVSSQLLMVHDSKGVFEIVRGYNSFSATHLITPNIFGDDQEVLSIRQYADWGLVVVYPDSVAFVSDAEAFESKRSRVPAALKFKKTETYSIYVDVEGVVWFNNRSELVRYDPGIRETLANGFRANVSHVRLASTGAYLFNGIFPIDGGRISALQPDWSIPVLDYDSQNLSFGFSATEYVEPEAVQYRHRIDGYEQGAWSEWSSESEFMTTNLKEGRHTIVVQAKDAIGRLSSEARYSFVILPPWYRTYWAYLAYLILGITALFSAQK